MTLRLCDGCKTQCWLEGEDIDLNITGPHCQYRDFEFIAAARTDIPRCWSM